MRDKSHVATAGRAVAGRGGVWRGGKLQSLASLAQSSSGGRPTALLVCEPMLHISRLLSMVWCACCLEGSLKQYEVEVFIPSAGSRALWIR